MILLKRSAVIEKIKRIATYHLFEDILCVIFLLLSSNIWSLQLYRYIAEPDRWDELWILGRAFDNIRDYIFDYQWHPLHIMWFKGISLFLDDRLEMYYLHLRLISTALPLALYLYCRSLSIKQFPSALAGFLFCSFPLLTVASRQGTHLAALVFLVLGAISFSRKTILARLALLDLSLFLVTLLRPDFLVSLIIINIFLLGLIVFNLLKRKNLRLFTLCLSILPLLLQVFYFSNYPSNNFKKSIYVYRDYSVKRYGENGIQGRKEDLFEHFYGKIDLYKDTLSNVLIRNPSDVLDHIQYSLKYFIKYLMITLTSFRYLLESSGGLVCLMVFFSFLFFLKNPSNTTGLSFEIFGSSTLVFLPIIMSGLLFGVNTRYFVLLIAVLLSLIAWSISSSRYPKYASVILGILFNLWTILAIPDFNLYPYLKPLYGPDNGCCTELTGTIDITSAFKKIKFKNLVALSRNNTLSLVENVRSLDPINQSYLWLDGNNQKLTIADYIDRHKIDFIRLDDDLLRWFREFKSEDSIFIQDLKRLIRFRNDPKLYILQVRCYNTFLVFPKSHFLAPDILDAFSEIQCAEKR